MGPLFHCQRGRSWAGYEVDSGLILLIPLGPLLPHAIQDARISGYPAREAEGGVHGSAARLGAAPPPKELPRVHAQSLGQIDKGEVADLPYCPVAAPPCCDEAIGVAHTLILDGRGEPEWCIN